jgi:glycosyltransferase involved in cell wall biosynthesis
MTRTRGLWTGADFTGDRELLLVEPGSRDDLHRAMQRLLDDGLLREKIGSAAREAVLHHGRIENFAARLGALLGGIQR